MKKIVFAIPLLVFSLSCTEDFEDINTNPNQPENATEELLLPTVIYDFTQLMVNETHNFGEVTAQYGVRSQFNDLDIYRWTPDDRFWSPLYRILQNVDDIESIAETAGNTNYKAVAQILKAYIFSLITDAYGNAPMSEANGTDDGIIAPAYDSQQTIYSMLFALLEEANASIDPGTTIEGDRLYGGDMTKWKKFANSLHLRLLLHASGGTDVSTAMARIIDDPGTYPVFESNEDGAIYRYSGDLPDISQIALPGGGRGFEYFLVIPSTHFINTLNAYNDPRLEIWVDPRACNPEDVGCDDALIYGIQPGQSVGNIGDVTDFNRRAEVFFESATLIEGIFMTYSELNFILAEARENGLIGTGNAQEFYNTAVAASFEQWGLEMPEDYLTVSAPYDNTSDVLYEQKWLALYHTGFEAWLDWKRTGKPDFIQAGPGTINGGEVPVRLLYPPLEQSLNTENYNAASSAMGGDDINSSAWWW